MQSVQEFEQASVHRAIVEQAPEAIILSDRSGMIRIWNHGAETVFGWAAAEVLGLSLDVIIPERLRRAHWDGYRRAMDSGATKHGGRVLATRSMHKNGSKLYVDLSFAVVKDPSGAVIGALAVGRDVTARYLAENELRAQIRALEEKLAAAPKQPDAPVDAG
jgi:PAS domain S-box